MEPTQESSASQIAAMEWSQETPVMSTEFGQKRSQGASLQTMPLEILNKIFVFTCLEDLDLSLLEVSQDMMWKLVGHPIVRTLLAFGPDWDQQSSLAFGPDCEQRSSLAFFHSDTLFQRLIRSSPGPGFDETQKCQLQVELLQSSWLTPEFVGWIQMALVKQIVKEFWDPLLERDGLCRSAISYPRFWEAVDAATLGGASGQSSNDFQLCLNDSELRYSWTRLRVSPLQGRVLIRDQLFNRLFEVSVPLLDNLSKAKERYSLESLLAWFR